MNETERAIDEALAGEPRANEVLAMIEALEVRRDSYAYERDTATSDTVRKEWSTRLRDIERQIARLQQEQAISKFVEYSVRSASMHPRDEIDDEDLDEP